MTTRATETIKTTIENAASQDKSQVAVDGSTVTRRSLSDMGGYAAYSFDAEARERAVRPRVTAFRLKSRTSFDPNEQ